MQETVPEVARGTTIKPPIATKRTFDNPTDTQKSPPIRMSKAPEKNEPLEISPYATVEGAKKLAKLLESPGIIAKNSLKEANQKQTPQSLQTFFQTLEPMAYTGRGSASAYPMQYFKQNETKKKKEDLTNFLTMMGKQIRNSNNTEWKKLGAEWDKAVGIWKIPGNKALMRKLDVVGQQKKVKTLIQFNQQILQQKLTDKEIAENIPNLVKQLIQANDDLSMYGFGKVSPNSLPFYGGRYIDPFTGRIKTMGMMSQKYLNPTSYSQHLKYLQSKVLAKWNNYVRAEQEYTKFTTIKEIDYMNSKTTSIKKALKKNDNIKSAFTTLWKQIQIWRTSLPVAQNIDLVCTQMVKSLGAKINQFFDIIKGIAETKTAEVDDAKLETEREKYVKQLEAVYTKIEKPGQKASVAQINLYAKTTAAFALWVNKGIASTQRALKKYVRTFIPSFIDPTEIQKVGAQIKNADQKINSIFGKLAVDAEGKPQGIGKLQQAKSVQQFVQSITGFVPKGKRTNPIPAYLRSKNAPVAGKVYPKSVTLKY